MGAILDGLVAYTKRHFERIDKLVQQSYLVDHSLYCMRMLTPQAQAQLGDNEKSSIEEVDSEEMDVEDKQAGDEDDEESEEEEESTKKAKKAKKVVRKQTATATSARKSKRQKA